MTTVVTLRRPLLDFEATPAEWTPAAPELSAVANALSLLMPFAEPFVVKAVQTLRDPDDADAAGYVAQESAHQALHRRFNTSLRHHRGVSLVERWIASMFGVLERRSPEFALSFANGFECLAFSASRWVDRRLERLFTDADNDPASLFLWHLAEESEHRGVVAEVMRFRRVRWTTRALGTLVAFGVLAWFGFLGTVVFLRSQRRLFAPWSWCRIVGWTTTYLFVALPASGVAMSSRFRPESLLEPTALHEWLTHYLPSERRLASANRSFIVS